MDNVLIPRVEKAMRSLTESLGRGPNRMVQNADRRDFSGNTEKTPLMSASSRVDLNIDRDRNDDTCNVENFEDGDFPALKPTYDRQARLHHKAFREKKNHQMEGFSNHNLTSVLVASSFPRQSVCNMKCW